MSRFIKTPKEALAHLVSKAKHKDAKTFAALKIIGDYMDLMTQKDEQKEWLFAKMFMGTFRHNLESNQSSKIAIEAIRMELSTPMKDHFKQIADAYTTIRDLQAFGIESANESHEKTLNDSHVPIEDESLSDKLKSAPISEDEVRKKMIELINSCLTDKSHYS